MNYPKDKLKIFLVDDGSTDNTWSVIQKFEEYDNISIFHKENGGKHTALNLGLEHTKTEFVGCLDADSFADKESLMRLMSYFEKDSSIMAVSPSVIVENPKTILQNAQKAEYHMAVYIKKMLGFLNAIHVTPGPLTIFRKKVFDDLGPYRHAHNTEDMEIAYRMQKNNYKIAQCNDAFVYTNTPPSVKKLFRQRLRWIYGFINNTIDYREVIFRKKYGNFAILTVPAGIVSIFSAMYLFGMFIYNGINFINTKLLHISAVGWNISKVYNFDFFYLSTQSFIFISILLYIIVISSMIIGRKMADGKVRITLDMAYFLFIYSVIAPFWLVNAIYNTLLSRKPAWR